MIETGAEKNKIYNRLIKSATNLLEWQNSDIRVLDPLVALFFGACTDEFERLYQDINSYQSRILERLSSLLLPDVNKNPVPSHAVIFAQPDSGKEPINEELRFYIKKNNPGAVSNFDSQVDVFFSPIGESQILDVELSYAISGKRVFKIENNLMREAVADLPFQNPFRTSIWLGLKPGPDLESLSGLQLFFDWPSLKSNYRYSDYLSSARFTHNGKPVEVKLGLSDVSGHQEDLTKELLFEPSYDPLHFTSSFYNDKFVTLLDKEGRIRLDEGQPLPDEFQNELGLAQKFGKDKLIWIKIEFDATAPDEMIHELLAIPNAFPVVNRKLNEFTYRLQNNLNLVPIEPEDDFFLGIESIASGNGSLLRSSRSGTGNLEDGTYLLRRGGIERFDSRDARTMLNHLIDLLRQENSAFKMMGYDAIGQMLQEIEQLINALDLNVNKNETRKDDSTYLFVKPTVPNDNLFVSYWSTNGTFANQLKVGTQLFVYSGTGIKQNTATLCSNTIGGKNPLQSNEALDVFKNALLTRDRIVSRSDIRHFCKSAFGDLLKEVNLVESFRPSRSANKGFEKFIAVEVQLRKNPGSDVEGLAHAIKTKLQVASGVFLQYEVNVQYAES